MNKKSILYVTLQRALSTKRPHNTPSTKRFTKWLRGKLPADLQETCFYDAVGNLHIDARTDDTHRTLFVAHVDTVHNTEGKNSIRKEGDYWHADGAVLGADDGAGCALLMHLIHAGTPAYYIFTQGEERGGVGAKHLYDEHKTLLAQFDRAIAFDRKGLDSVITHQGYGRCCSDAFGNALCAALGQHNDEMMHLNDDTGVYTDTAEFTEIIPECTNISVGYYAEHTQAEKLNTAYYQHLAKAVLTIDWDGLPTERDPRIVEDKFESYTMYGTSKFDWFGDASRYGSANSTLYDYRTEELFDALINAKEGYANALAHLIAECAYPDDPSLCMKHMNMNYLDAHALECALEDIDVVDTDTLLLDLFDVVHTA
jgi:hypothetical protein